MQCHHCHSEVDVKDHIGRGDTCPSCGANLRCCFNCLFYDPGYANACREPQVEPVVDKEAANFCEFFAVGQRQAPRSSSAADVRAKLDALFKKKS
ncbi:MAG: hypothetical protein AB7G75_22290 [Candidatus Binatia bacterium]